MSEHNKEIPPSREEILAFRIIEILKNEEFTKSQMQETLEHVKKNYNQLKIEFN